MNGAIRGNIPVLLEGRGKTVLRDAHHIATGGEGVLYRVRDAVVKVYTDADKMQRDNMAAKIRELTRLTHTHIVAPKGLVFAKNTHPIGYWMSYVDGEPLTRVFTNSFWKRTRFSVAHASTLVEAMRDVVHYAHGKRMLLVDPNELNWLVVRDAGGAYTPRILDVDSWSFGAWPPQVVMLSIRDVHARELSELSDWFAWGVVTFQVYTGIHPYKGMLAGFKPHDIEARMRANASVFRDGVRLNRAVRDFSHIPGVLLDWYEAVFEHGERSAPPSPFARGAGTVRPTRTLRVVQTARGALRHQKLFAPPEDRAVAVYPSGVVRLASGALADLATGDIVVLQASHDAEVISLGDGYAVAEVHEGKLVVTCHSAQEAAYACPLTLAAHRVVRGVNRLFAITDNGLREVRFPKVGKHRIASPAAQWDILPHATEWFDGIGVMDALGAAYLIVPFGGRGVAQVRVRELDGMRVVSGVASERVAALVAVDDKGVYQRLDFSFDTSLRTYKVATRVVDVPDLNAAALPKGVIASIEEDGELRISVPATGVVNKVADAGIRTDMALAAVGNRVVYIKDGAVWSLAMQ